MTSDRSLEARRELSKHWFKDCQKVAKQNQLELVEYNALPPNRRLRNSRPTQVASPPFPEVCRGLICGAKAKSTGNPCKRRDLYSNGRCPLHGGLSTGPRTEAGKAKSARNGLIPKHKRR